jgi:hypothetical protein
MSCYIQFIFSVASVIFQLFYQKALIRLETHMYYTLLDGSQRCAWELWSIQEFISLLRPMMLSSRLQFQIFSFQKSQEG